MPLCTPRGDCRWPWLAVPLLVAELAALLALGACGLKTPPRPLSTVLPPTAGVRAWQREERVMVAWLGPGPEEEQRFGGLRGFELWLQPRALLCPECPPVQPSRLRLRADAAGLQRQGALVLYALPLAADVGQLRVQVRTEFGLGMGPAGPVVAVERAGAIPTPRLEWRWASGGEAGVARSVLFSWEAPQERIVQVIGADGRPREHVQRYRANLYRRVPPGPWGPLPLNGEPLQATRWIVPPLQAEFPPDASGEAYALRYVDQFSNEGPPSPDVLIPLTGRRP